MTWLAPSVEERDYVTTLADDHPQVYRLALVLAPALRVEPLLLRNARLRFVPRSDAALEARFWFSPLIANRSARAVVLRPGLARAFTDRLDQPDAPFTFAEVWAFIQRHSHHWPALDRLEQDLRQAARNADQARIRDGLRHFLQRVEREPDAVERRELARWVKGALPDITGADGADGPAELAMAAQFAAASLGDFGGALGRRARDPGLPTWLARQVPPGKGQVLGLRLHPGVLECLPPDAGGHRIEFDLTAPVPVHIRRDDDVSDPGHWEPLQAGRKVPLPAGCRRFVLTTPTGARYRLAAVLAENDAAHGHQTAGWETAGDLVVAYLPEDREAAERVLKLLQSEGIAASLVPEASAAAAAEGRNACLVRLWSRAAADRTADGSGDGLLSAAPLVLRVDETPLTNGGTGDSRMVDLSRWQGGPVAPEARDLVDAVRSVLNAGGSTQQVFAGLDHDSDHPIMSDAEIFDCLLSHNSRDKPAVRTLAKTLRERGISVWLDEERLRPGVPWQYLLEAGIRGSKSVAVLVGASGLGPWQEEEMQAALLLAVRNKIPVIPVLLPDAPAKPKLPMFLHQRTWLDMRSEAGTLSALDKLIWGITGNHPDRTDPNSSPGVVNRDQPGRNGRNYDQGLFAQSVDSMTIGDASNLARSDAPAVASLQTESPPVPATPPTAAPNPEYIPVRPKPPHYAAFISYARVDNLPLDGPAIKNPTSKGWVRTLSLDLEVTLGRTLGHKHFGSIWIDELSDGERLMPENRAPLADSWLLVLILSPAWFASARCREELATFLTLHPDGMERLVVVWIHYVARDEVPAKAQHAWDTLHRFIGYQFWDWTQEGYYTPRPLRQGSTTDLKYYQRLDDLTGDMTSRLKTLMAKPPESPAEPISRQGIDIFISYARQDQSRVEPIARVLASLGYAVWLDADLLPGARFDAEIERALAAARCVLVVWTEAAVNSNWVRAEATEAMDANKLVPVFLEPVKPPLYFFNVHGVNLSGWDGTPKHGAFQRLLRDIADLAGPGVSTNEA